MPSLLRARLRLAQLAPNALPRPPGACPDHSAHTGSRSATRNWLSRGRRALGSRGADRGAVLLLPWLDRHKLGTRCQPFCVILGHLSNPNDELGPHWR